MNAVSPALLQQSSMIGYGPTAQQQLAAVTPQQQTFSGYGYPQQQQYPPVQQKSSSGLIGKLGMLAAGTVLAVATGKTIAMNKAVKSLVAKNGDDAAKALFKAAKAGGDDGAKVVLGKGRVGSLIFKKGAEEGAEATVRLSKSKTFLDNMNPANWFRKADDFAPKFADEFVHSTAKNGDDTIHTFVRKADGVVDDAAKAGAKKSAGSFVSRLDDGERAVYSQVKKMEAAIKNAETPAEKLGIQQTLNVYKQQNSDVWKSIKAKHTGYQRTIAKA